MGEVPLSVRDTAGSSDSGAAMHRHALSLHLDVYVYIMIRVFKNPLF